LSNSEFCEKELGLKIRDINSIITNCFIVEVVKYQTEAKVNKFAKGVISLHPKLYVIVLGFLVWRRS